MATIITPRVKKSIVKSKHLEQNVMGVFTELDKLVDYYKSEVGQIKFELGRETSSETQAHLLGSMHAYNDHIAEVSYIRDMLRDIHRDMEE